MGLDQYAHLRNRKINWENFYSEDEQVREEEQKDLFVWRKHARLQTFFAKKWREQNVAEQKKRDLENSDLHHLGFNGDDEVYITEDIVKELEEQWKNNYWDCFAHDGFFWGQQFQEEAVKEYKAQDEAFIKLCKEQIKNKKVPIYTCSW